jgi:hypothetical protein
MRQILLSCAILGVLTLLPVAASAQVQAAGAPGYLVVREAADDGGVNGRPVVTLVVRGFVLGRVGPKDEAQIDIYQLASKSGAGAPTTTPNVSHQAVRWRRRIPGQRFSGTGFRFLARGGFYRVVVRGSGVYLFAGGHGNVTLRGSSLYPHADGKYSIDGAPFRSVPLRLNREIGKG